MADIQAPLETTPAGGSIAGGDIASNVYRDEPIRLSAERTEQLTPPQYREMRKLARRSGWETGAKIFYEQGKLMETFEDHYDYEEEFAQYFPTYQSMSDRQLRGYFSWRTGVRRGCIEKTSLSFAFVHIYELLNQIGVDSPMAGYLALKRFQSAYGEIDHRIAPYLRLWIKDYVVYNDLDQALFENFIATDFDRAVLTLQDHRSHGAGEVFDALNSLSSYRFDNSRFFKRYPDDAQDVVYGVFDALSEYCGKKRKRSICERFLGKLQVSPYAMFRSAVFHHQPGRPDSVYEVNDVYRYRCQRGSWSCERFFGHKNKLRQIGALLKTIDFLMRQAYGFKSTLKIGRTSKLYQTIIAEEIAKHRQRARKKAASQITIDISQLQDIRHAALTTQNKLIVGEIEDMANAPTAEPIGASAAGEKAGRNDAPQPANEQAQQKQQEQNSPLNEDEYRFLACLLHGRPYDDLIRTRGLMPSLLVDAVNEKLFDSFGDTVIVYDGDKPVLIEDYIDDLKGIIAE